MTKVQFSERTARIAATAVILATVALALPAAAFDSHASADDKWGSYVWSDKAAAPRAYANYNYYTGAADLTELRAHNTGPLANAAAWPVEDASEDPAMLQTDEYYAGTRTAEELRAHNTGPLDNTVAWPEQEEPTVVGSRETADSVPNVAASLPPSSNPYWDASGTQD